MGVDQNGFNVEALLNLYDGAVPWRQHFPNLSPEQSLIAALIENAVTGLRGMSVPHNGKRQGKKSRERRRLQHAVEDFYWFIDENEEAGRFLWCCENLGISPSYLRKIVLPLYMTGDNRNHP